MDRRKTTIGVAAATVVAGVTGLALLAAPAGAGPAPSLPATTPEALVGSVLTARPSAMNGTIEVDNQLGLPTVPGVPQLENGTSVIRVWSDGAGRGRVSLPTGSTEQTFVDDGTTEYEWNSADRTVVERPLGRDAGTPSAPTTGQPHSTTAVDPADAARELVTVLRNSSTISVTGTDTVAGRAVYDLALTPKPTERTLLREVIISIDAREHLPLRLTVLASNSATPVLRIGFSSVRFGPQDPALFHFTPPAGATVTHGDNSPAPAKTTPAKTTPAELAPRVVGTGWDAVVVARVPSTPSGTLRPKPNHGGPAAGEDPLNLVRRLGTPVHGAWGSGWVISTNAGTALVTSDGRLAAGFVPQQVLIDALAVTR